MTAATSTSAAASTASARPGGPNLARSGSLVIGASLASSGSGAGGGRQRYTKEC
jgi:hypothetical protein